jgi:hypothetical protein
VTKKPTTRARKPQQNSKPTQSSYEQAIDARNRAKNDLDNCAPDDRAKYTDAWTRAANVVRQYEKENEARGERERVRAGAELARREKLQGRNLDRTTPDEQVIAHIVSLPMTRQFDIRNAVQASLAELAKKPLF